MNTLQSYFESLLDADFDINLITFKEFTDAIIRGKMPARRSDEIPTAQVALERLLNIIGKPDVKNWTQPVAIGSGMIVIRFHFPPIISVCVRSCFGIQKGGNLWLKYLIL